MRPILKCFSLLVCLLLVQQAQAELTIEVTRGNDQAVSMAVSPFGWKGERVLPEDPAAIIDNDLKLSGLFRPLARSSMLSFPSKESDVYYRDWKVLGASYLVTGEVNRSGQLYTLNYQLYDIVRKKRIGSGGVTGLESQLRGMAHRVSDAVYEKITGLKGDFSTRILYVTVKDVKNKRGEKEYTEHQLVYADADGQRERTIMRSKEPILAPAWSPDGDMVSYVSFETGRSALYMHDLVTGKRKRMTHFKGVNNTPSWSPGGEYIAMALSMGDQSDIYVWHVKSKKLSKLTTLLSEDTEPDWMPDGNSLVFTSNRGGSPQVYQLNVRRVASGEMIPEGKPRRLTFQGRFNARAKVFPDGKSLALVHKSQDAMDYNIAVLDLETDRLRLLTSSKLADSPSIAPGGRRLIYSAQGGRNGELGIVSADGRVKHRLPSAAGDVREPAWGPSVDLKR